MDKTIFEDYLEECMASLNEKDASYASYHRWDMFLPENYEVIRADMNAQKIAPNVVDIGCGAGFGSEFFLDGSYIGVDESHPHIGVYSPKPLGEKFFNQGKPNVSYVIDTFPSDAITGLLKKKTAISSMCLGAYGEMFKDNCKEIFESYCKSLQSAQNIYICAPKKLTNFVGSYFGGSKEVGEHVEFGGESCTVCPIIHVKMD